MQQTLHLEHRQQTALSPRLQHAVRLLQMSSADFAQELHDVIARNPFLEPDEGQPGEFESVQAPLLAGVGASQLELAEAAAPIEIEAPVEPTSAVDDRDPIEIESDPDLDGERDSWQADGSPPSKRTEEGHLGALDLMPVQTSLRDHLHGQLDVLRLPPRDVALAKAVVESLDDDGYLRAPLDELVRDFDMDPPPDADELRIALKRVQALEPAGVAARTVAECLLLQLPKIGCEHLRADARRIVEHHFQALAAKDVNKIAEGLSCTPARVEEVIACIRRLDPRPGWRFDSTQTAYVVPDVVVRKVRGQWTALLNPTVIPRVRINQVYAELFQRHRRANNTELAAHLQEARWTLRNVEQRFVTILSVAQAIVQRQWRFLELGPLAMKPLGLREIALETGMHESTVSRVTNNKYMATPLGVFELKYFFSRAMTSTSGNPYSGTAIRGLIREMIEEERRDAPLSDAQIARLLAQQGLVVARRTVTKYRQALRIAAVERRRMHN